MKQTDDASDQRAHFAHWLRAQIIRCGYDLDRRGEQANFARDAGMPSASITRLLSGTATPDIRSLRQLAPAIRRPLPELLIRAGLVTEDELSGVHTREDGQPPISPEQAVHDLGITEPDERAALVTMIQAFKRTPPATGG